jgi:type IV pilus assembly protein PilC
VPTTYAYKVRDRSGKVLTGSLDADNPALVAERLRAMGFVPISIDRQSMGMKAEIRIPGVTDRVKLKEVALFSRQFATMIGAGLTLLRSLSILANQVENKTFAVVVDQVRADVQSGSSLSQALGRHPRVFSELYVAMVRAGESSGSLDHALADLADMIEAQVELRSKIKSAMTYPIAVLSMVLLILSAMLLFIVPVFKKMYKDLGGKLPLPTRILITVSNIAVKAIPVLIVLAIIGAVVFRKWIKTPTGRMAWDRFKLKVPIFGKLIQKISMARFASTLSTLLRSGVPILESLEITSDTVANAVVAEGVGAIAEGAKKGEPLSHPLGAHPVFPPMVVQMMSVGEETGALDSLLTKVSQFYQQEVSATVDALTSLLEPLLIGVLGGCVGLMVISLYLPMFNVIKLIQ